VRWEKFWEWYDWAARAHFAGTIVSAAVSAAAGGIAYIEGWDWLAIALAMLVSFAAVAIVYLGFCTFWDRGVTDALAQTTPPKAPATVIPLKPGSESFTQSAHPIDGETWSSLLRVADEARRATEGTELAFTAQDYGNGSRADVLAFYAGKLSEHAELYGVMPPSPTSERITQHWPANISFHVNGSQMDSAEPRSGKELYRFVHMLTADVGPALAKIQELSASGD
jgi:hypothetical protein